MFFVKIVRTQNTLDELEERKTGIKKDSKKNFSVFLLIGLLFNSVALVMGDSISYYFRRPVHINQETQCAIRLVSLYFSSQYLQR